MFISAFSFIVNAQDSTQSLAFKNKRPQQNAPYFYRPDLAYQIWQKFRLTQEANAGDPLAQHELGLRFLLGEGVPADTAQAVYWIKKAADHNLTSAKYNPTATSATATMTAIPITRCRLLVAELISAAPASPLEDFEIPVAF